MALSRRRFVASAAAVSASGVFAPAIAQNSPLRIGILAPRSGIAAAPGLNGIRATEWAVERYNAQGGIAGRKIELVIGYRAAFRPASGWRSGQWSRRRALSRFTGTAPPRTA